MLHRAKNVGSRRINELKWLCFFKQFEDTVASSCDPSEAISLHNFHHLRGGTCHTSETPGMLQNVRFVYISDAVNVGLIVEFY
jgi:hypothetical protein